MAKSRLTYMFLLLASAAFLYFTGERVAYWLFYIFLLLPVFSLLLLFVSLPFLRVTQKIMDDYTDKNGTAVAVVSFYNHSPFYIAGVLPKFAGNPFVFSECFPNRSFCLHPGEHRIFRLETVCLYRGTYRLGLESIRMADLCGLFSVPIKSMDPPSVHICPRITGPLDLPLGTGLFLEQQTGKRGLVEDMSEVYGIRDYTEGDPVKRIHWKLTAQKGNLVVRQFLNTDEAGCTVVLDPQASELPDEINIRIQDKLAECAASITGAVLSAGIKATFVCFLNTPEFFELKDLSDLEKIKRVLSEAEFVPEITAAALLRLSVGRCPGTGSFIVVSSRIDESLCSELSALQKLTGNVQLVLVSEGKYEENLLSLLRSAGVRISIIFPVDSHPTAVGAAGEGIEA